MLICSFSLGQRDLESSQLPTPPLFPWIWTGTIPRTPQKSQTDPKNGGLQTPHLPCLTQPWLGIPLSSHNPAHTKGINNNKSPTTKLLSEELGALAGRAPLPSLEFAFCSPGLPVELCHMKNHALKSKFALIKELKSLIPFLKIGFLIC